MSLLRRPIPIRYTGLLTHHASPVDTMCVTSETSHSDEFGVHWCAFLTSLRSSTLASLYRVDVSRWDARPKTHCAQLLLRGPVFSLARPHCAAVCKMQLSLSATDVVQYEYATQVPAATVHFSTQAFLFSVREASPFGYVAPKKQLPRCSL